MINVSQCSLYSQCSTSPYKRLLHVPVSSDSRIISSWMLRTKLLPTHPRLHTYNCGLKLLIFYSVVWHTFLPYFSSSKVFSYLNYIILNSSSISIPGCKYCKICKSLTMTMNENTLFDHNIQKKEVITVYGQVFSVT